MQQTIASAKEVQTGTRKKLIQLAEKLRSLRPDDGTDAWKIKSKIDTLRSASERSLATIPKLKNDHQRVLEEMAGLRKEIEGVEGEITRIEGVRQELDDVSRIREGIFERNPIVETLGTIHEGTTIRGPHASLVIRENCSQAKVSEVKLENKDTPNPWRMVVEPR